MTELRRRICAMLLVLALLFNCVPAALAVENTAATVRLAKTEGTVSVTSSSGRSISLRSKMRIYNGYHVETEESSYAWLDLDDTKACKLDAVSEMEVRKSGKQLELLLNEGNLFFNVAEPLDDDESLNIRTSTMILGIRGTCGWVKAEDERTSRLYVLEGSVEVAVSDPVTGETKSETVDAGNGAVCVVYPQDQPGDKCEIIHSQLQASEIEGFVLTETVPDEALCERINEASGLDLRDYAGDPADRLRQDQEAVEEKLTEIEARSEQQESSISTEQVWTNPVPDPAPTVTPPSPPSVSSVSSSGSDSSGSGGSSTVTLVISDIYQANGDVIAEIHKKFSQPGITNVIVEGGPGDNVLSVSSDLTVPKEKTLRSTVFLQVINDHTLQVDGTLITDGDLNNIGTIIVTSGDTLRVGGSLTNSGTLQVTDTGKVVAEKTLTNHGTLDLRSAARVLAKSFAGTLPDGWTVKTPDSSEEYSTLEYAGGTVTPPAPTYTVTFNANGGSVSPGTMTTSTDGKLTQPLPTPARTGYTFDGWFTAADGGTQVTTSYEFSEKTTVYAHWILEGDGWRYVESAQTLYITVTGPMQDYREGTAPWYAVRKGITTAVIESGVTNIGNYAFSNCSSLTRVEIPASVTDIGVYAFYWCTGLTSVTIPEGVISIGAGAFFECNGLISMEFPESVTSIGGSAFNGCDALTSVTIPRNVASIGSAAFIGCKGLTALMVDSDNPNFKSVNGVLFNQAQDTLLVYPGGKTGNPYEIPNGVTRIEDYAFSNCTGLTSVTIPDSVTNVGAYAFNGCTGLTDVYYGGTAAKWSTVSIGSSNDPLNSASIQCTGDGVSWRYHEGTKTLQIYGNGTMESIDGYTSSTIPWAGHKRALTSVKIGNGVTSIATSAFEDCAFLTSVTIPGSVASIDYYAFQGCENLTSVDIPEGVTSIKSHAFENCIQLTSVDVPSSVTSIGNHVFSDCGMLTSVNIPSGVTSIDDYVFSGCGKLTSVNIPEAVTSIGEYAFKDCYKLTSVNIPEDVTILNRGVFQGCEGLTSVDIPEDVTSIGSHAFDSCKKLTSVDIPSGVTEISNHTFYLCGSLTSVNIPDRVTSIGQEAFNGCGKLTSVDIPAGVTSIGPYAFQGCTGLTSVTIPDQVTGISDGTFQSCFSLTSVTIPDKVQRIGTKAFDSCINLTSVTIPDSVTIIDLNAFQKCNDLAHVYYAGSSTQWNNITIVSAGNDPLDSATIHYNYTYKSAGRSLLGPAARPGLPASWLEHGLLVSADPTAVLPSARAAVPISSLYTDVPPVSGYTDVPKDAWYAEAADYCREQGLMVGTGKNTFSPDAPMTRAMLVTVLHSLAGTPPATTAAGFPDVEAGAWYTEAVSWAREEKIVVGYPNGKFGTNNPVTHEQVQIIFRQYSGDPNLQTMGADSPQSPATRAEVAATLMKFATGQITSPGALSVFSAMDVMCAPSGIALDRDGSLLVTDVYHKQVWHVLRRASESYAGGATVQDLYGRPVGGYNDADLDNSYFKEPWAIAPFLDGWAVSDAGNNVVRLIQSGGVQTLNAVTKEKLKVTDLGVEFSHPTGLTADGEGNLYVSDTFNGAVRKITPQGGVSTAAQGLFEPTGLCWKDDALYIAETGVNRILVLRDGKLSVLAGNGEAALTDGRAEKAAFSSPQGITVGDDGSVYVADTGNGAVRRIKGRAVSTLISRDMKQAEGGLTSPAGLLVQDGRLYICDTFARKVFVYQLG